MNNKRNLIAWLAVCAAAVATGLLIADTMNNREPIPEEFIGRSDIKIKDGVMTPEALVSLGRITDPQVSPDGKWILYSVSYTSIEENKSVRNLRICSIDGEGDQMLSADNGSISNARWSPDGKMLVFIRDGQIFCSGMEFRNNEWRMLHRTQLSDVPGGISEFSLSPDASSVMFVSTVKSNLKKPSDIYGDLDKASAYCADDLMYRHWDHWVEELPHTYVSPVDLKGRKEKQIGTGAIDILGGGDVKYELPTEPFSGIEQLCWSPDGRFIAYSCRKKEGKEYAFSTCTDIFIYDTETGETVNLTDGGGYDTEPIWSPDGKGLAWLSMERDGYEADKSRLMLADITLPDGSGSVAVKSVREISAGFKYNVASPSWSDDSRYIWFNAEAEGLTAIFKADTESSEIFRITSENDWHDYGTPFHVDGDRLLVTRQSLMAPAEIALMENGAVRDITSENGAILSQLKEPAVEERWIRTVDGKDMLTWVIYPPDFDASKVYPSILICLGGPQGSITQGWSYRWCYRLMAQQGYIVVLPNRRGTTAFGQEWCEQISGDYCGLNMQDYLSAARALKSEPYVGKMAACGASYGGYSVYYLCGNHENTFDCFVSHDGIFNEEHMYYTTEEMWFPNWDNGGLREYEYTPGQTGAAGDGVTFGGMQQAGSPWSNAPKARRHYANSPHMFVQNWNRPLLVIHGGNDFRVPYDEGMAAFNCAQMMGVESKLVIFPDENHWVLKPQNSIFWHRQVFSWLDKWCR